MAELEKILCTDSRIEAAKKINAIVDAMGEGDLANIDLSNLSSTGQAKFDEKAYANEVLKKSQLTNCLLEVPQNIKLEIQGNSLVLKAGSKVIIPNGVGVFDEITTTKDLSVTLSGSYTPTTKYIAVKADGTALTTHNYMGSGTSTTADRWSIYYNTETGLIGQTGNYSELNYTTKVSLPIAITTFNGVDAFTSIDQVFNGMGYIGSTIWVDKGIKMLIPNGRNTDRTLKNKEVTTNKVTTNILTGEHTYIITSGGNWCVARTSFIYNEEENLNYFNGYSAPFYEAVIGIATGNKTGIASFQPKLPVRLLTYDDVKINNPYFFGQYIWSEFAPDNLSWLKSSGQWNSGSGYQSFYDWALANANANKAGFKLSTASYTDYDFVVNTSDKTFRLPIKVQNTPPNNTASVVGNGMALGLNSGTVNFGMVLDNGSSHNYEIFKTGAYGASTQGTAYGNAVATPADYPIGVTTDPTKSGLVANLSANTNVSLYFYVGETVKDPTLINMAQVASNFADKLDRGNKVEITNWCTPDYTAKISITAPYTAPKAGIVIIDHQWSNAHWTTSVNGVVFMQQLNASSYGERSAGTILVGAGDVITTNATWESAVFVPMKGVK